MRYIITACCLLLIGACKPPAPGKPKAFFVENFDTALRKTAEGWVYKGVPLNGYIVEKGRGGRILYQLPVIHGKEEGQACGWYNTGEKLLVRNYKEGKKEGALTQWWPNGRYRYLFNYEKDVMHGRQLVFYPGGQKRQESNFLKGKEEGIQRVWSEDGQLLSNYTIKNGKLYGVNSVKSCLPGLH